MYLSLPPPFLCSLRNLSHNKLAAVDMDILSNLPNLREVWVEQPHVPSPNSCRTAQRQL